MRSPTGYGFPFTFHPLFARGTDTNPFAANDAYYYRVSNEGTVSKIGLEITASSGNISVAVYANGKFGRDSVPAVRLATSGAIACPTIGYVEIALDATVKVNDGDWLALSADNVTATFRAFLTGSVPNTLGQGLLYSQATAHPLPAVPSALTARVGKGVLMVGVV